MTKKYTSAIFTIGEIILLVDHRNRNFLIKVPAPGDLTIKIHGESFKSEDLITLNNGALLISPMHKRYLVFKPTLQEIILNMPRQAQIIYPKDIAVMLMWGDISPGQYVLEVGCGLWSYDNDFT